MKKLRANKFLRTISTALTLVLIVSLGCLLYSFIAHGIFSTEHITTANIVAGALVVAGGLTVLIRPTSRRDDKLLDSTTYVERTQDERERKRKSAYEMLLTGIAVTFFALVLDVVLWLIW